MSNNREKVMVTLATIMFFSAFGAILLLDGPHTGIGVELESESVSINVIENRGNLKDAKLPEGLLIFGAGQQASLDFKVNNRDPDNDIDTIRISIPDSQILNGSTKWYQPEFTHEWTYERTSEDTATFTARDDWFGRAIGGSAQYDVVGNIDDALDYFDANETAGKEISEGITINMDFTAPSNPGMKMGDKGIDLLSGDLKTEGNEGVLSSNEPFPYPYIVAENNSKYLIMVLENEDCDLEVMYGDEQLFTPTRADDFLTSTYGYKYTTTDGITIAVLEEPAGTLVTPLVKAKRDNLTGQFTLDIFNITIEDITSEEFLIEDIVSGYTDDVPPTKNTIIDNDIDDDGLLNNLDDDIDGDGLLNQDDDFPRIFNRPPVIISVSDDMSITEGEALTLSVEANDPDNEPLFYFWTHDKDPAWNATGMSVTLSELEPGIYNFSVEISDELGNIRSESVVITVLENLAPVIESLTSSGEKIKEGTDVTLSVVALDDEGDPLTYSWSLADDPAFVRSGSEITVSDLEEGSHVFTVTVSDGRSEVRDTIIIEVEKDEDRSPIWPIILIAVIIFVVISIVLALVLVRKKNGQKKEDEIIGPLTELEPELPEIPPKIPVQEETNEVPKVVVDDPEPAPLLENEILEVPVQEMGGSPISGETDFRNDIISEEDVISDSKCPECGTELEDLETKCPNCGIEFELDVECPNCGKISSIDETICHGCGGELSG